MKRRYPCAELLIAAIRRRSARIWARVRVEMGLAVLLLASLSGGCIGQLLRTPPGLVSWDHDRCLEPQAAVHWSWVGLELLSQQVAETDYLDDAAAQYGQGRSTRAFAKWIGHTPRLNVCLMECLTYGPRRAPGVTEANGAVVYLGKRSCDDDLPAYDWRELLIHELGHVLEIRALGKLDYQHGSVMWSRIVPAAQAQMRAIAKTQRTECPSCRP